jgi:hypothetical protein
MVLPVAGLLAASRVHAADREPGQTHVGGMVFVDASDREAHTQGMRTPDSGINADLTRFFVTVDHRFSDIWSVHATTDINWRRHSDPSDLWLRYAYVQGRFDKAFTLRLGSALMPWVKIVNKWYGFRYVEKGVVTRAKMANPVDWGVHVLGSFGASDRWHYAAAAVTGAGFKKPRLGNGPDIGALLAWQSSEHTVLAINAYRGTLGKDAGTRRARHTARRHGFMAAYDNGRWRVGGQYFRADDWNQVLRPASENSHGWSAWVSVQVMPVVALFARHDHIEPSRSLDPDRRDRYSNAGVEWKARKNLRLAAVYKRQRLVNGGVHSKRVNEVGIWGQLTF